MILIKTSQTARHLFYFGLLFLYACANKKSTIEESHQRPAKPIHENYAAYDAQYNWVLEMDINGNFTFVDYNSQIKVQCPTGPFQAFQETNKQGLQWLMQTSDSINIKLQIFESNCHSLNFKNNPFFMELSNELGVFYRLGNCGTYHQNLGFQNIYALSTINNEDFSKNSKLLEAPQLKISKIKTSNLIEGSFGCRTWRSQLNLLDRTFGFNLDLYPNMSCQESPELSQFMERISGKLYFFMFSENNNKLTLSDKNDTFVFLKIN
jgi:hypothetical protein